MTLTVRHNAPTLKSTAVCPACGAPMEPEAKVCTQCGLDLATGKQLKGASGRNTLLPFALMVLVFGVIVATYVLMREHPQGYSETKATEGQAVDTPGEGTLQPILEDPQDTFSTKKARAAEVARQQLDESEPLYQIGDPVELRQKNGILHRGTLMGYSGEGTNRVAIVATPINEIGVYLSVLDNPSRRRADPEYREQFLQHLLNQ